MSRSDGHRASSPVASPRRKLPDAATCRPSSLVDSARVLRPKPRKTRLHGSVARTRPRLGRFCGRNRRNPPWPVLWTKPPKPHHVLALAGVPTCQSLQSRPASQSLSPSLTSAQHRSRSGTARLYLTFTSPSSTAWTYTPVHHEPRDMLHGTTRVAIRVRKK